MPGRVLLDTTIIIALFSQDRMVILPVTAQTAETYGRVKDGLRQRGRPIPENDIWIAAAAPEHDLDLAARDVHFGAVEGLRLQRW